MQMTFVPALAAAVALSTAALAQDVSQQGSQRQGMQPPAGQPQQQAAGQQAKTISQDQLRQSLEQAGFTDVTILDESFLVQAQTADGTPVVMVINPPMATGDDGAAGQTGRGGGQTGGGQGSGYGTTR